MPFSEKIKIPELFFKHLEKELQDHPCLQSIKSSIFPSNKISRCSLQHLSHKSIQGLRSYQEDDFFITEIDPYTHVIGVFDGHFGGEVSHYMSANFLKTFEKEWEENEDDLEISILNTFQILEEEVAKQPFVDGSTACLVFIDKLRGQIATATLGDSEARVYRQNPVSQKWFEVPISLVRNWSDNEESERAHLTLKKKYGLKTPSLEELRKKAKNKTFHLGDGSIALNISRSIGDSYLKDQFPGALSAIPELAGFQLQPKDILVIASDGLWDEQKHCNELVLKQVEKAVLRDDLDNLSEYLSTFVEQAGRVGDNATIISLQIL